MRNPSGNGIFLNDSKLFVTIKLLSFVYFLNFIEKWRFPNNRPLNYWTFYNVTVHFFIRKKWMKKNKSDSKRLVKTRGILNVEMRFPIIFVTYNDLTFNCAAYYIHAAILELFILILNLLLSLQTWKIKCNLEFTTFSSGQYEYII